MPHTAPEAIVTDVGGVKRPIMENHSFAAALYLYRGHPMADLAGGIEAANPSLFECCLRAHSHQ